LHRRSRILLAREIVSDLGQHPALALQPLDFLQPRQMIGGINGSASGLHRPVEKSTGDIKTDGSRGDTRCVGQFRERLRLVHAPELKIALYYDTVKYCFILRDILNLNAPAPLSSRNVAGMTKSVLWDLDGTLVDSEQYHWLAWRDTMAAEGVSLTHEEFLKTFGLRNDAIIPQWISGATPERIDQIANAKERHYRRLVREGGLEPLPGARHWTELLAREGWLQAIASSAPRENVDVVLAVIGLAPCFQAIVSAEDVTHGKPDPQVFLTAAARLGSVPARSIVVEDAPAGIEAARRAGMASIGVRRNGSPLPADLAVSTLTGLPPDAFSCLLDSVFRRASGSA
jgi:HAD superfamily hydrolase (TIGR01509 family)